MALPVSPFSLKNTYILFTLNCVSEEAVERREKPKRKVTRFTMDQVRVLEAAFRESPRMNKARRAEIMKLAGIERPLSVSVSEKLSFLFG